MSSNESSFGESFLGQLGQSKDKEEVKSPFAGLWGKKEEKPVSEWVIESEKMVPLRTWEDFAGVDVLKQWAAEVKELLGQSASLEDWFLTGKAVALQVSSPQQSLLLARLMAHEAGARFVLMGGEAFTENPQKVLEEAMGLGQVVLHLGFGKWLEDVRYAELIAQVLANSSGLMLIVGVGRAASLPVEFRAPGAFDRAFLIPAIGPEARGRAILSMIGEASCSDDFSAQLGKIGKLLGDSPIEFLESISLQLKRLAIREQRKIEFSDLIDVLLRDCMEGDLAAKDDDSIRAQVAFHEAGHAAMGIIDSMGRNVPEYASITGAEGFKGVVMPSLNVVDHFYSGFLSYKEFRHELRISLAGRAAEELVYGPGAVCHGARGDLEKASKSAFQALAQWGFAPDMEAPGQSATNLAVVLGEGPNEVDYARLHELTRQLLEVEYRVTLRLLEQNRALLDAIQARLMIDPIVDQSELQAIIDCCGIRN